MAKVEIKRMTEEGTYKPKKVGIIGKIKNGIKTHKKKIVCTSYKGLKP